MIFKISVGSKRDGGKTTPIDTTRESEVPRLLFRVLIQDTIYDSIHIRVFNKKTLGYFGVSFLFDFILFFRFFSPTVFFVVFLFRSEIAAVHSNQLIGELVIPASVTSTMAKVPRVAQCWWPLRKGAHEFVQPGKERGELLVAMSFLDGIVFDQLPPPIRLFGANMHCKVVEAQSLVLERVDINCSVGISSAGRPAGYSSMAYKSLMPVYNENFPLDCADPFVDQVRIAFYAKGKKLLGHALIPTSIVATRAAMSEAGTATLDFWFPLLDRHAGNQLENSKSCGKVHVVLYFGCSPSVPTLVTEPLALVALVERLSTKNSFVKRWLLLRGPTHLPPTIYNFHEKNDADCSLVGRATSATVVAGAVLGPESVSVPRGVTLPPGRALMFRAHDGSRHVLVFADVGSRDLWHQTLVQFATVVGNWYEPMLTGVTPTLCEVQPRVRAVVADAPPMQGTVAIGDSGSLLSGTMDYFISRGVGVKPNDDNDDDNDDDDGAGVGVAAAMLRRSSGGAEDEYVDESIRYPLETSPSYPDVKYVHIDPMLALKAQSDEEAAFRQMELDEPKKKAPKVPQAAAAAATPAAAVDIFSFSPMPPPTPSPSDSPPLSPRTSAADGGPTVVIPSVRELTAPTSGPSLPAKKTVSSPPATHVDEVTPKLPPKKARSVQPAAASAAPAPSVAPTPAASHLAVPGRGNERVSPRVSPNVSPRASPRLSPRPSDPGVAASAVPSRSLLKRGSDPAASSSTVQHQSLRARATASKPAAAPAAAAAAPAVAMSHMYAGVPVPPEEFSSSDDEAHVPPPPRESAVQSYDRVPVEDALPVPPPGLDGYGHMPAEKVIGASNRQYALLPLSPQPSVEIDEESLPPWGGVGLVAEESKS